MTCDSINRLGCSVIGPALGGFALRLVGAALGLAFNVVVARKLGAGEYGVFATLTAGVAILGMIASIGLPALATRCISSGLASGDETTAKGTAFLAVLGSMLASGALAIAVFLIGPWLVGQMPLLAGTPAAALAIAIGLVPLQTLALTRAGIVRGMGRPVAADLPDLGIRPLLSLILLGSLLVLNDRFSLNEVLEVQLLAAFVAMVVGAAFVLPLVRAGGGISLPRNWFSPTVSYWLIGVIGLLLAQLPLYLLGMFASPAEAGRFAGANQFAGIVLMAITATEVSVQSRISSSHSLQDRSALQRVVTETARLGFVVSMLAAVSMVLCAPLAAMLLGPSFEGVASPLRILLIGYAVNAFFGPSRVLLSMTGNERVVLNAFLLNMTIMGAFGVLVIPIYGAVGAATVAVMSSCLVNVGLQLICWQRLSVFTSPFARNTSQSI